jgi:hypothetical protein
MMSTHHVPADIVDYHRSGRPLICEIGIGGERRDCEFWALDDFLAFNREYQVSNYAPGFIGFATNGGGEMFALSPEGKVVCLPFIGMSPAVQLVVADSWDEFAKGLKSAQ